MHHGSKVTVISQSIDCQFVRDLTFGFWSSVTCPTLLGLLGRQVDQPHLFARSTCRIQSLARLIAEFGMLIDRAAGPKLTKGTINALHEARQHDHPTFFFFFHRDGSYRQRLNVPVVAFSSHASSSGPACSRKQVRTGAVRVRS